MKQAQKIILVFASLLFAMKSNAVVRIDITDGNTDPLPIALTNLAGDDVFESELGRRLSDAIRDNLASSGLFNIVDSQAHLQSDESLKLNGPDFEQWKPINVEGLFVGTSKIEETVENAEAKKASIEYRLFDIYDEKQSVGKKYTANIKFWKHIANRISDDIYTSLTGESGYFSSRIAYIAENYLVDEAGNRTKIKQLCIMNQDTSSQQCLTDGRSLVLTPRFSPVKQELAYLSYANGRPRIYLLDLNTGKQEIVGDFKGLNSAPRFSPDGEKLLMTLTKDEDGNSEVYEMKLKNKRLKKLTFSPAIDTSASYSPDGEKIVFNSDRPGKPTLYIMDEDGNNLKRLTYGRGNYYAPVWSPRGDVIAFVKQLEGKFHIGVIEIDEDGNGGEERLLTEGFLDESPTWAPNGRVIIFARQVGDKNSLYAVDLTGYNLHEIKTNTNASDPSWSRLVK
ncbi:MAG: Tol-Pal system protein TolB [Proteobacteria bacterium]|nr:Tol-Pal system protein TolB [Pseudomonadota bacterium]